MKSKLKINLPNEPLTPSIVWNGRSLNSVSEITTKIVAKKIATIFAVISDFHHLMINNLMMKIR